jgi:hypothetical protein
MLAKGLTPILNVSNIQESFAWFEKLGACDRPTLLRRFATTQLRRLGMTVAYGAK